MFNELSYSLYNYSINVLQKQGDYISYSSIDNLY